MINFIKIVTTFNLNFIQADYVYWPLSMLSASLKDVKQIGVSDVADPEREGTLV